MSVGVYVCESKLVAEMKLIGSSKFKKQLKNTKFLFGSNSSVAKWEKETTAFCLQNSFFIK